MSMSANSVGASATWYGLGETQPHEPEWNVGGYENNAVQRVPVVVR